MTAADRIWFVVVTAFVAAVLLAFTIYALPEINDYWDGHSGWPRGN